VTRVFFFGESSKLESSGKFVQFFLAVFSAPFYVASHSYSHYSRRFQICFDIQQAKNLLNENHYETISNRSSDYKEVEDIFVSRFHGRAFL